ncbi:MAG TPA: shikimate dehydrogenase [Gemmatirosa sp.]|nr:shikimate dehydrogenase [Gemmatirosa sp.]
MTPPPHVSRLVLLGHPVAHSLSPAFQNAALRAAGLAARYSALDVAPSDLPDTLRALTAERAAGNVTVPHKEAAAGCCDRLAAVAARTGAVNTFWVDADGALVGDNTDVEGFDRAASALLGSGRPSRVALLGAGGSARAVLAALSAWPGTTTALWSRSPQRARAVAANEGDAAVRVVDDVGACVEGAELVVNATPLGLGDGDPLPVAPAQLAPGAAVLDLVYRPGETAWVRAAREAGHPASDGLPMLLAQGALAFERWFGRQPDPEVMWAAIGRRRPATTS